MKITFEPSMPNHEYSRPIIIIDNRSDDKDIFQVFEELIIPALYSYGFAKKSILDACAQFGEEEE